MSRSDRWSFGLLLAGVVMYLIVRAILVPLVHDECASVLWFVEPRVWLPFEAHWDANNHYLSTGISIVLTRLFGAHPIVLRGGSLLAFLAYAWAAWRMGSHLRDRGVRWTLWSALLLCPYLLDFFALFRGYGIEMAGWLCAVDGIIRYERGRAPGHLVFALCGLLVAGSSIVALLPAWVIAVGILGYLLATAPRTGGSVDRRGGALAWVLLAAVPLTGAAMVGLKLRELGLLYHGSTDGFLSVTVASLCAYVLGSRAPLVMASVLVVVVVSTLAGVMLVRTRDRSAAPLVILLVLLWADVFLRYVMAAVLGVNYPEDRAALHLVPLVISIVAFAVDGTSERFPFARWGAVLLLVLPARTPWTANLDHSLAWPEQSVPLRFVDRVADLQRASTRPLVVGGHHQLALCWPLNARLHGRSAPFLQVEGFPRGRDDLRIVDERFLRDARAGYRTVDSAMGPGLWLLQRIQAPDPEEIFRRTTPSLTTSDEFLELAHPPDSMLRSGPVLLTLRAPLSLTARSPDVRLVIEITDDEGGKLLYDAVPPFAARSDWNGEPIELARMFGAFPTCARAVVYLYNPGHTPVRTGQGELRVARIRG